MNIDTKHSLLPSLTVDLLAQSDIKIDNVFSNAWQQIGFKSLLHQCGFKKRSGAQASELVYLLMLWVWLKVDSVGMFSRDALLSFSSAKKDALYDLLNREDLDWRKCQLKVAKKVIKTGESSKIRAFVVDDSVKIRRGKKMPGVSSHFDHLTSRCVMGQQILTLGFASDTQFVPLDNEIFISKTKIQPLVNDFSDGRSITAKRYKQSLTQTKPEMVCSMIRRAIRAGIEAEYFLADAWFGTKPILKMTEKEALTGIVRMKKNKMKYQTLDGVFGSASELYQAHIKGNWKKVNTLPYQSKSLIVKVNLAQSKKEADHWIKVKLLFVRGVNEEKEQVGKNDWALFLSTDSQLSDESILEIYALRWGIEVYFKEAKQKLGFLKEQSRHYSAYIASIHLTGLRFCLLLFAKHESGAHRLSDVRNEMEENMSSLNFASKLWGLFKALISGALGEIIELSSEDKANVMAKINKTVINFFTQVMQMDSFTLRQEAIMQEKTP